MTEVKNPVGYPKDKPWSPERLAHYYESGQYDASRDRMIAIGKVKTDEQKQKMREAKLGKPKTADHAAAMSNTHKQRWAWFAEVSEEYPELDKSAVWVIVRQRYY